MSLHNSQWMMDASINSGQLLENLSNKEHCSPEIMYPFDALYSFLAGDLPTKTTDKSRLPFGMPNTVHVKNNAHHKIKDKSYHFRSTLDGKRIALPISVLQQWLNTFSILVLPKSIADIQIDKHIQTFIELDLNTNFQGLEELSKEHGIAIELTSEAQTDVLIKKIEQIPECLWYIYGSYNLNTFNTLSYFSNVILQTNTPFEHALKGNTYDSEHPFSITAPTHELDQKPIKNDCTCKTCLNHSRSYLHHLYKNTPILAVQLLAQHNLHYWQH